MNDSNGKNIVKWLKIAIFLAVIVGIPVYLFLAVPDFGHILTDREAFKAFMSVHERQGLAIYLVIQFLQVIMGFLPAQIIQFIGGFVFGIAAGFILSLIGTAVGTFVAFHLARHFGREFVSLFVKEKNLNKFVELMDSGRGYTIVILVFLIPGLPKDIFTYAAGLTRLRAFPYTLMTVIARAPAMLATILFSGFLEAGNYTGVSIVFVVIAALLITILIKRKSIFAYIERLHARTSSKPQ
ncbi:MAG: VTT domain-containing protein [Clostridiales Family XIII bacterium]|jgi:uncharacterized membrane protein YdjX (TVP38/TMEM64 family)|nr:VTT domain-containing protein [Clostridiales Family XIII bacterium]